jgi:hypothetical protein
MEEKTLIDYYFPYLRRGQGASLAPSHQDPQQSRVQTSLDLDVKASGVPIPFLGIKPQEDIAKSSSIQVSLYGPGDVLGFDSSKAVLKAYPTPNENEFPPLDIPFIEFKEPDFLWRYSVQKDANQKKFWIPWLSLVVLKSKNFEVEHEFEYGKGNTQDLPGNIIITRKDVLPDLSESWRWAHVHYRDVEGLRKDTVMKKMAAQPQKAISRLICPRRLAPNTKYTAFVVPTYLLGKNTALGLPNTGGSRTQLSWGKDQSIKGLRLPYYYKWDFQTGRNIDFETTLRKIKARPISGLKGKKIDISNAGYGMLDTLKHEKFIEIDGAVRSSDQEDDRLKNEEDIAKELAKLLHPQNGQVIPNKDQKDKEPKVRVIPPIYGRWINHQEWEKVSLDVKKRDSQWLDELNLKIKYRIAAGLGAQYAIENQEALMDEAWKQLKKIQEINRKTNLAKFGREMSRCLHKRLDSTPENIIKLVGAANPVIEKEGGAEKNSRSIGDAVNLYGQIDHSIIPNTVFNSKAQKYYFQAEAGTGLSGQGLQPLANASIRVGNVVKKELEIGGVVHSRYDSRKAYLDKIVDDPIININNLENFIKKKKEEDKDKEEDNGEGIDYEHIKDVLISAFGIGGASQKTIIEIAEEKKKTPQDIENDLNEGIKNLKDIYFQESAQNIIADIQPEKTIQQQLSRKLDTFKSWEFDEDGGEIAHMARSTSGQAEDPLRPIMAYPEFHVPMYKYLKDLSEEYLIPGIEHFPENSVAALTSDNKFIEAFMVGLNHEMANELRWREYPTDMRGSYFRSFWETTIYSVDKPEKDSFWYNSTFGKEFRNKYGFNYWSEVEEAIANPEKNELAQAYEKAIENWLLTREEDKDIQSFHKSGETYWYDNSTLGHHNGRTQSGGSNDLILVIRAEVFKKYPGTIIYLAPKDVDGSLKALDKKDILYPIFEANFPPDIFCLGFPVNESTARNHYIIFEERSSERRFGMDENKSDDQLENLSWDHFNTGKGKYLDDKQPDINNEKVKTKWNNPAYIPKALKQKPVRMAIDLDSLLP